MTSNLTRLIDNLNTKLVIFIENDFVEASDSEEILSKIIILSPKNFSLFLNELEESIYSDFKQKLEQFYNDYWTITHVPELVSNLVELGRVRSYLSSSALTLEPGLKQNLLQTSEEITQLIEQFVKNDLFKDLVLRFGAVLLSNGYQEILDEIKKINGISFRFYKNIDFKSIEKDIEEIINSNCEFCLFIIDKVLSGTNEDGREFIEKDLFDLKEATGKNIVSILFTSNKTEFDKMTGFDKKDYFKFQVHKESQTFIEDLSKGLSQCAYVHSLERLKNIYSKSIDKAFQLIIDRRKNMCYLANMAHEEGMHTFEAIGTWFDLAIKKATINELIKDNQPSEYLFISGLTSFLKDDFSLSEDGDFSPEIDEINTFEIFDYSINKQHLSPAPGDIFVKDGDYYILAGQECEFMIRGDSLSRTVKSADLIPAKFDNKTILNKIENKKIGEIGINYFKTEKGEVGFLNIDIKERLFGDFKVIDTCVFNNEGNCNISLTKSLDPTISKALTFAWINYYKSLQKDFINLSKIQSTFNSQQKKDGQEEQEIIDLGLIVNNNISIINSSINDDEIDFNFKRICRLKGNFRDLVIKNYTDYRGRIAINTISQLNINKIKVESIKYGFPGDKKTEISVNISGLINKSNDRKLNEDFKNLSITILKNDLKRELESILPISLELSEEKINIDSNGYLDKNSLIKITKSIEKDKFSLIIEFPFITQTGKRILEEKINLEEICETKLTGKFNVNFLDQPKNTRPFTNKEMPSKEFSRGFYLPDLKIKITLDKTSGSINVEKDVENIEIKDSEVGEGND